MHLLSAGSALSIENYLIPWPLHSGRWILAFTRDVGLGRFGTPVQFRVWELNRDSDCKLWHAPMVNRWASLPGGEVSD